MMDADSSSAPTDRLLSDLEWLGSVARRLVSDPELADDACQEAWLLASRRDAGARLDRGRLVQFLRSYAWRARRSQRRRKAHEARASRADRLPSTEELLLIGERQQELWRHLSELPEPYRSVLLLHFQQGYATSDIAERTGVPVDTVRWRLRRGLQLLRESLERDGEGTELSAFVPVAATTLQRWQPSPSVGATGLASTHLRALLMTKNLLLVAGVVVLLVLGWAATGGAELDPLARSVETEVGGLASSAASRAPEQLARGFDPGDRDELALSSTASPREAAVADGWSLAITVLRPDERAAVAAEVMMAVGETTQPLGATDEAGRLVCPLPSLDARGLALWDTVHAPSLVVSHPRFATAEHDLPIEAFERAGVCTVSLTLTGGPCLRGRVLGASGLPLTGARCLLWEARDDGAPSPLRSTLSDSQGRFALAVEPDARGFVMVEGPAGVTCTQTVDIGVAMDIGSLYVDELASFSGRVVDPNGRPAQGVQVLFHGRDPSPAARLREDRSHVSGRVWGSTSTDADGRFEFLGVRPGPYVVSVRTSGDEDGGRLEVEVPCAEVTLTTPHPRLRVLVRDVNGVPAGGLRVHLRAIDGVPADDAQGWFRATDELGAITVNVTHGATYALVALGRFGSPVEQVVQVPKTGFQHEAHVVIGESSRSCRLRVQLVRPDGGSSQEFSILLRSLPSRLDLEEEERGPADDGLIHDLPQGRVSVKLYPEIDPGADEYLYLEQDEQVVDLDPDHVAELRFELRRGGHVDVSLDFGGWPEGAAARAPETGAAEGAAWLREHGVFVDIVDAADGATPSETDSSQRLWAFDERRPWSPSERWTPGTTARNASVLKPGRYAYRVSGAAWLPVVGVLDVQAGATTRLAVALRPR